MSSSARNFAIFLLVFCSACAMPKSADIGKAATDEAAKKIAESIPTANDVKQLSEIISSGSSLPQLTLQMSVRVDRPVVFNGKTNWQPESTYPCNGQCSVQFQKGAGRRIVFVVSRPHDRGGTFKAITPIGNDGISWQAGQGADVIEMPWTASAIDSGTGVWEFQRVVEGGTDVSYGQMTLWTYDAPASPVAPTVSGPNNETLKDGDHIPKGWWVFAQKFDVGNGSGGISLCVHSPDGSFDCAADQAHSISFRSDQKGQYVVQSWDDDQTMSEVTLWSL